MEVSRAMSETVSPTPFTEINQALAELEARIRAILGRQFVGMYLYGSLAIGDFDPQNSDIDFLVVTDGEVPEDVFAALKEMHAGVDQGGSPWAGRVEAAYIPREAVNDTPGPATYPQVERGMSLARIPLEDGWVFQRHTLREQGITISGKNPGSFIHPVSNAEKKQAAEAIFSGWLERSRRDDEWITWARTRKAHAFIVLTTCRMLYSLETGEVCSKPAAARWAQKKLGRDWSPLIKEALKGPRDDSEVTEEEYLSMLRLLQLVLDHNEKNREEDR
jgi:hypothetical protein